MKKLFFCTFILLMFLLPATSFADMHPYPRPLENPCEICAETGCMDCNPLTIKDMHGECSVCIYCHLDSDNLDSDDIYRAKLECQRRLEAENAADETRRADNSQPQANAEQPQAEEAYNMRKPRVLCSAVPNIPPSIPIACLLMLLISLGLLIHLRRMEK